ncbi:unnamed protein product [Oncorhynchus mykiss]|uniref:Uncharacterized protein n=1 Tax=Oncorhynchus mykiss TaxID=8022 RepID=A0A060WV18_ONCMY|nr:unnamed protein product [Oncorhynchus mykiss]
MPLVHRRGSKSNILVYKICVDIFLWCVFQEGLLDDDFPQKEVGFISAGENEDEEHNGIEDSKQALGLDENSEEEPEERDGTGGFKKSKGVKIKFVPHRGFAICLEKDEPTGAHEYTPRRGSKMIHEKPLDELKGAHGYTPRKESKVNIFEETEEVKGYIPQSHPKQSFLDDYLPEKGAHFSSAGAVEEYQQNVMEDCKPKKSFKFKAPHKHRKETKVIVCVCVVVCVCGVTAICLLMLVLVSLSLSQTKARDERMTEYPPGATSSDYYFSEAAEAEWRSAQIDEQLADGLEDEEEEEEEEGVSI